MCSRCCRNLINLGVLVVPDLVVPDLVETAVPTALVGSPASIHQTIRALERQWRREGAGGTVVPGRRAKEGRKIGDQTSIFKASHNNSQKYGQILSKEDGKIEIFVVQFVKVVQNEEFRWLRGAQNPCIVLYCIFVYSQTWVTRRTHLQ